MFFLKFTSFNLMLFGNKYTDANKTNTIKERTRELGSKEKYVGFVPNHR